MIAKLPKRFKEAAKTYNTEKYVLLEWDALERSDVKKKLEKLILKGEIAKRSQLKRAIANGVTSGPMKRKTRKAPALPKGLSANAFLKAMNSKSKDLKMDKKTRDLLKNLLEETKEMVDL